jgi:hypothetical protein
MFDPHENIKTVFFLVKLMVFSIVYRIPADSGLKGEFKRFVLRPKRAKMKPFSTYSRGG